MHARRPESKLRRRLERELLAWPNVRRAPSFGSFDYMAGGLPFAVLSENENGSSLRLMRLSQAWKQSASIEWAGRLEKEGLPSWSNGLRVSEGDVASLLPLLRHSYERTVDGHGVS